MQKTSPLTLYPLQKVLTIKTLLLFSCVSLLYQPLTLSQEVNFCGVFPPHQALSQNLDSVLFDRFGNSYDLDFFHGTGGFRNTCGYFSLEFENIPDLST